MPRDREKKEKWMEMRLGVWRTDLEQSKREYKAVLRVSGIPEIHGCLGAGWGPQERGAVPISGNKK
jgi:hypothetical protein